MSFLCSGRRRWAHLSTLHLEPVSQGGMRKALLWPQLFWRQFFNAFTLVLTPCPNPFLLWGWIPHWFSSESPWEDLLFVSGDLSSTFYSISPISRSSVKFSLLSNLVLFRFYVLSFQETLGGRIRHACLIYHFKMKIPDFFSLKGLIQ